MGIIDDVKKTGSSVAEGAGRTAKVAQAQIKLPSLKWDVSNAKKELGAVAFDLLERGELAHAELDTPLAKVKDALAAVAAKEAEISALKTQGKSSEAPALEAGSGASGDGTSAAGSPVNLNTATLEQLNALSGVGPGAAQKIIDFREIDGGFSGVEQLLEVPGIGDAKYAALKDQVTI